MDKGFGFIAIEGGEDVFFHMSSYNGNFEELQEGQAVTFDMGKGPKGPKAENVVLVGGGTQHGHTSHSDEPSDMSMAA